MSETKTGQTIQVPISSEAWLTRNKFEIPNDYQAFFPVDALGARDKDALECYPVRGRELEFDYGVVKDICDMATWKSGRMRPRKSQGIKAFYSFNKATLGDVICITRVSERCYQISLIKR